MPAFFHTFPAKISCFMQALINRLMQRFSSSFGQAALLTAMLLSGLTAACSDDDKPGKKPDPGPGPSDQTIALTSPIEGKVFFEKGAAADNYYIGLYCGEIEMRTFDDGSTWVPSDAQSRLLYLDLYAPSVTGTDEIRLPEGTYTVAADQNAGSANSEYTYGMWYFDTSLDYADATGGTVTVVHTAIGYHIAADLEMVRSSTGESLGTVKFSYNGILNFTDITEPDPDPDNEYPPLKEHIATTFVGADIHYLGVPAYSSPVDVYVIELYDDSTPLPDGTLDEGNVLHVELYTGHQGYYPGESNVKLPAGTYSMTDGYVPVEPGIGTGDKWDSGYGVFPYGSYVRHLDEATGKVYYGFAGEGGQVTVSVSGDTYTIAADLKTRDGHTVKGTYTGAVEISNEAQEPERQTQSRIYEDKVLDLAKTTSAKVTFEGTSRNDMTHFYSIFAQDPASRQGFQLELLAPVGEIGSMAGTYKPSEVLIPLRMVPYTYIPGDIQLVAGGAAMIGTWGYYETNANGKAAAFAPALTGDIVVDESGSGASKRYTIDYVLTDDNPEEPHTMTASFSGTFDIKDATKQTNAAPVWRIPAPAKSTKRVPAVGSGRPFGAPKAKSIRPAL